MAFCSLGLNAHFSHAAVIMDFYTKTKSHFIFDWQKLQLSFLTILILQSKLVGKSELDNRDS